MAARETGFRIDGGCLIDRNKPLQFRFDGKLMHGFEGDTLASALLANGVGLLGRSFKYVHKLRLGHRRLQGDSSRWVPPGAFNGHGEDPSHSRKIWPGAIRDKQTG